MAKFRHKQVDLFLSSLADAMRTHAIGIIFSGLDGDGTEGCRHVKAKGGGPLSAQASGCIDFVLPAHKIPDQLLKIAEHYNEEALRLHLVPRESMPENKMLPK